MDPQEGEPWPVGRSYPAAVCVGYGDRPQLLVTGGWGFSPLSDMWLLDVTQGGGGRYVGVGYMELI